MVTLPFCHLRLTAPKPQYIPPLKAPITLGDHIRNRRLTLGLTQDEAAQKIGVVRHTIVEWEANRPILTGFAPKIYDFLGYAPYQERSNSFHQKVKFLRESLGLSQLRLGQTLGATKQAVSSWETETFQPTEDSVKRLEAFFAESFGHPVKL
ncbi:MAG: helix-turn-helix domain-containing protein [Elusimicrobiales bacterium]|nr:helix-turn-helix domain-containing protein [Elusimicrobiales bacterium]